MAVHSIYNATGRVADVMTFAPVVLLMITLIMKIYDPMNANLPFVLALLMICLHEFVPLGQNTISRVNVASEAMTSNFITVILVMVFFITSVVSLTFPLSPYQSSENVLTDIISFLVIIVPTVILFGFLFVK